MIRIHETDAIGPALINRAFRFARLTIDDCEMAPLAADAVNTSFELYANYEYADGDPPNGLGCRDGASVTVYSLYVISASHPAIQFMLTAGKRNRLIVAKQLAHWHEDIEDAILREVAEENEDFARHGGY